MERGRLLPTPSLMLTLVGLSAAAMAGVGSLLTQGLILGLAAGLLVAAGLQGRRLREADLELERELPRRLGVGREQQVVLRLRNRGAATLRGTLVDGVPPELAVHDGPISFAIGPYDTVERSYTITPLRRGLYSFQAAVLRLSSGGGLAELQLHFPLETEARVQPDLGGVGAHALRSSRRLLNTPGSRRARSPGREGEFDRLRDFVTGDDLRHVDWKATARRGHPITRVYQEERSQPLLLLVDSTRLMATRADGRSKLDHALQAALQLIWTGLSHGDRVGVGVFGAGIERWLGPAAGMPQFGRAMELLYDQQCGDGIPRYRPVARALIQRLRRRSLVVWITDLADAEQGTELVLALRAIRGRHLSLVLALQDAELGVAAGSPATDATSLFRRAAAAELLEERQALLARLSAEGAQVLEKAPSQAPGALVDRYLALKQRGAL